MRKDKNAPYNPKTDGQRRLANAQKKKLISGLSMSRGLCDGIDGYLDLPMALSLCDQEERLAWAETARKSGNTLLRLADRIKGAAAASPAGRNNECHRSQEPREFATVPDEGHLYVQTSPGLRAQPKSDGFFEMVELANGERQAKLREGFGYGDNCTATFIYEHRSLWAREIEFGVGSYAKQFESAAPITEVAREVFKDTSILRWCPSAKLPDLLRRDRTPTSKAIDVLKGLFPTCDPYYIERSTRRRQKK